MENWSHVGDEQSAYLCKSTRTSRVFLSPIPIVHVLMSQSGQESEHLQNWTFRISVEDLAEKTLVLYPGVIGF